MGTFRPTLHPLTADQWALVVEHLPRIEQAVQSYRPHPRGRDDDRDDALIGLVNAARWFDPGRGPFGAFAWKLMRWSITNGRDRSEWVTPILDAPLNDEADATFSVRLAEPEPYEPCASPETIEKAAALLAHLSPRVQKQVLSDNYYRTAEDLNVKPATVQQTRGRHIARIKRAVNA